MTVTIKAKALEAFVADIFAATGCSKDEGGRIGRYLVSANLSGHDSHGVVRVPRYASQKKAGTVLADVKVEVVVDTPVIAVVDGKYGFGQTVAPQAVRIGIDKCKANGLGAVTLRNAGHVGRVGDWAELAAAEGLVSVHFVNASGSVLVAPYGGVERRFSTAPYCVGIPRPGEDPLVLDFATSIVAEGKVLVASQGGKKVPEGALIGPDGKPSADPHLLYGEYTPTGARNHAQGTGAIRAFGDHKGSGLAFMCEMLGGSFTGNGATDPKRGRFANGMLSFYLDPKVFDPEGFFPKDIAKYVAFVKSSRPSQAGGEILVPGEPEARMRKQRLADGVPLPDDTWAAIVETARSVGLDERRIQQAASPT
jgi:hydroxycarboxylate dehydrogenase B